MKLILTGATGFVGSEVFQQCLYNSAVESLIVLSRRPLPYPIEDPKIDVIFMKDFTSYPEDVMAEPSGADACIWAMTAPTADHDLDITYPMTFVNQFATTLTTTKKRFRYVHLSGQLAGRDEEAANAMWYKPERARIKGQAELRLIEFATREQHAGLWETYIVKSSYVPPKKTKGLLSWAVGTRYTIGVHELAAALVEIALHGGKTQTILGEEMVIMGRQALNKGTQ